MVEIRSPIETPSGFRRGLRVKNHWNSLATKLPMHAITELDLSLALVTRKNPKENNSDPL